MTVNLGASALHEVSGLASNSDGNRAGKIE